ncbi:hypothetical protein YC2023_023443 [Brassica napus]
MVCIGLGSPLCVLYGLKPYREYLERIQRIGAYVLCFFNEKKKSGREEELSRLHGVLEIKEKLSKQKLLDRLLAKKEPLSDMENSSHVGRRHGSLSDGVGITGDGVGFTGDGGGITGVVICTFDSSFNIPREGYIVQDTCSRHKRNKTQYTYGTPTPWADLHYAAWGQLPPIRYCSTLETEDHLRYPHSDQYKLGL